MLRTRRRTASVATALLLGYLSSVACGHGGGDGDGDGSAGAACEAPADCYADADPEEIQGEVECLDRVPARDRA